VEIANYYSSPRSGQFINGVLYNIANYLKEEGKLTK
ncbi:MAG: transcription antitermination factor NusB, partial [Muribaculaceae bacterium]|nr:transcription antitermination factor NusB [Muribaculaceae bacterium]